MEIPIRTLSFFVYWTELSALTSMLMERRVAAPATQYPAWFHGPAGRLEYWDRSWQKSP